MKYPANISGEEYAAMEEGYEQGRDSAFTAMYRQFVAMRERAEKAEAEVAALRDRVHGHEAMKWPEEAHRLQQQRDAARAMVDTLNKRIDFLSKRLLEYEDKYDGLS